MPDRQQLIDALRKADAAGDTAAAQRFAQLIKAAPPQENSGGGAPDTGQQFESFLEPWERPSVAKGAVKGALEGAQGIVDTALHPIDSAIKLGGAAAELPGKALNAVTSPRETAKKVMDFVGGLTNEKVGKILGNLAIGGGAGRATSLAGDLLGPAAKELLPAKSATAARKAAQREADVREVAKQGGVMTPGQRRGGMAGKAEELMTRVPIVGNIVKEARSRPVEQVQRGRLNQALKMAGQPPLEKGAAGHAAIDEAIRRFDKAYDEILPKMKGSLDRGGTPNTGMPAVPGSMLANAPKNLRAELEQLKSMAGKGMKPEHAARLSQIIDNDIIARFTSEGMANGTTLKQIGTKLRELTDGYRRAGGAEDHLMANGLKEAQAAIDRMIVRENPKLALKYGRLREGYARLMADVEAAAKRGAATSGVPTANQFLGQVLAREPSTRLKGAGKAPGQKSAGAAARVLSDTIPNSGTPEGAAFLMGLKGLLTGGGAAGGAAVGNPVLGAALGAGAPIMYSEPVLRWLQERALAGGEGPLSGMMAPAAGLAAAQNQQETR